MPGIVDLLPRARSDARAVMACHVGGGRELVERLA
jgi:hypothetical protein